MFEVELKVPADHATVRETLIDAGADPLGTIHQVDTYYAAPHRDFARTDEALRVRQEHRHGETTTKLTYKGPKIDAESKSREEHETTVADGDTVDAILDALGFEPVATVEKERHRYTIDEYTVTLDDVTDLGQFVEIETDVDARDAVESARQDLQAKLADLGLDPDESIRTSYLGLLLNNP